MGDSGTIGFVHGVRREFAVVQIHERAVVESGADLGEGVQVGPFCYVAAGARVGDGCVLGPHSVVHRWARLGEGCRLHAGAVIGDDPQDLSFDPATESYVEVGDHCLCRGESSCHGEQCLCGGAC